MARTRSPQPTELTTLSGLVEIYGRDVRYWSGYVDGAGIPTYRGPNNSKAVDRKGLERIRAKQPQPNPVASG